MIVPHFEHHIYFEIRKIHKRDAESEKCSITQRRIVRIAFDEHEVNRAKTKLSHLLNLNYNYDSFTFRFINKA